MRIVSLLPAATEIVGALGMANSLVGISHECDFPPEVQGKPRVTRCELYESGLPSEELDRRVRETVASGESLYTLDEPLLRGLRPDVILTQRLCDVCAVGYGTVAALAEALPGSPKIVNLEPATLEDVWGDIGRVGEALRAEERAGELAASLRSQAQAVASRAGEAPRRPRCFLMEWVAPPFCAGHWNPELVRLAGGEEVLGRVGQPSRTVAWDEVLRAAPEVLVVACCGYRLERTLKDVTILQGLPGWGELPAVREGRVYAVDAVAYFSRPGPRLVESLEILAGILHPELFRIAPDLAGACSQVVSCPASAPPGGAALSTSAPCDRRRETPRTPGIARR